MGPPETVAAIGADVDDVVCLKTPTELWAVGAWYDDFSPTGDDEVLRSSNAPRPRRPGGPPCRGPIDDRSAADSPAPRPVDTEVEVAYGAVTLCGRLSVPVAAIGVVCFAHGRGSSRHSPRNQHVASLLNRRGSARSSSIC